MTNLQQRIPPHTLYSSTLDTTTHYRLFLDDIIHEGAQIHEILNALHNSGDEDTLELRINSGGGYVRYGHQLINVILGKFKGRSVTIIESDAASMAALVFMAGDKRVVYEHSTMMVHDLGMVTSGKVSESKKQLEAEHYAFISRFKHLFSQYLTEEEISDIFDGKDKWFCAEEMCRKGIATHVFDNNHALISAEEFLSKLDNPTKFKTEALSNKLDRIKDYMKDVEDELLSLKEKANEVLKELEGLNENSSN